MAKAKKTLRDLINPETETVSEPAVYQVTNVLLKDIYPCDTNPRKSMDEDAIIDLAKSMHDVGLRQPITIRLDDNGKYEIVSGHRRFKAAQELKWHSIPAMIREVGDEEILEIQIIENLQREDLSAMDEAAGFKSILQRESFDWLCSRIHKSKKYISDRLKLNDLVDEAQGYVHLGILPITHAIMISKLPIDEQKKCIEKCIEEDWNISEDKKVCTLTTSQLREFIEDVLMIDLDRACFDLDDSELVPAAGACAACPKRTGNQNLLFQEITEDDKCTDAACYHIKEKAHVDANLKKAKEDHGKDSVFTGQVVPNSTSTVKVKGINVPFTDKKAKGKDQVCVVVTKDGGLNKTGLGKTVWVDKEAIEGKVKQKEENKASGTGGNSNSSWEERRKNEFKEVIHPRLLKIVTLLDGGSINNSELISFNYLRHQFEMENDRDVIALAAVLGLYHVEEEKLLDADDDVDWEVKMAIIDKLINHIQSTGIPPLNVLAFLLAVDNTDDARTADLMKEEESVALNWVELMELIEGKKEKPVKKASTKKGSK